MKAFKDTLAEVATLGEMVRVVVPAPTTAALDRRAIQVPEAASYPWIENTTDGLAVIAVTMIVTLMPVAPLAYRTFAVGVAVRAVDK